MKPRSLPSLVALSLVLVAGCESGPPDLSKPKDPVVASGGASGAKTAPPMGSQPEKPQIPAPPDVAAPPADALKTKTGIAYKVLSKVAPAGGDAGPEAGVAATEHPTEDARVKVHYTGWTTDGKMFDSSVLRGMPATFPLKGVIPGWTEGVQLMTVGEKTRFWIPEELAYKGKPGRPQGMLVFDIELLEIKNPIPAPPDVAKAPADAKVEKSGIASKVITAGKGTAHPTAKSEVEVHYTGWTTDGKMFDSSVSRGEPARFALDMVIKGWTEGVQLMVEGEKRRFWIPEELAYKGGGGPQGTLVFDVELLKIVATPPPAASGSAAPSGSAAKPAPAPSASASIKK